MKHETLAIVAQKGGTGKTTTAGAIAQAATEDGKRVLLIDLDPQCDLSIWQGADLSRPGSYDLLTGSRPAEDCIQKTAGIDIAAGRADLAGITQTRPGSARRLETALEPLRPRYDLIVIDTAPMLGELQNNAIFAADGILIPLEAAALSLQAYYQLMDILNLAHQGKQQLETAGVILTQYDGRANISKLMRDTIKTQASADNVPYLGEIRKGIAIQEAQALRQSLFGYAPKSKPAQDYKALYEKLI